MVRENWEGGALVLFKTIIAGSSPIDLVLGVDYYYLPE